MRASGRYRRTCKRCVTILRVVTASFVLPSERAIVVAAEQQVSCEVGGEAVLLQMEQGVYYGLNPVAARVWQLIQTPRSISAIVSQVEQEFDVEPERCARDVLELVARLAQAKLVVLTEMTAT